MLDRLRDADIAIARNFVRTQRAWHGVEGEHKTGIDVVDFLGAPFDWRFNQNPYLGHPDIILARENLLSSFRAIAGDVQGRSDNSEYMAAVIDARIAVLELLTTREPLAPEDMYARGMRRIAGYQPRLIPFPVINEVRKGIEKDFSDQNGETYDRPGWERAFNKIGIDPSDVVDEVRRNKALILSGVVRSVGARSLPKVALEVVDLEEYWIGWISTDESGTKFRLNQNPINQERFFKGVPFRLVLHEVGGHAIQAQNFRDNIEDPGINPARAETSILGPEQWGLEGWACSIARIYPNVLDSLSVDERSVVRLAVDLQYLTDIALTNAQYEILASGRDRRAVIGDLLELLPHESPARIELVIKAMTERVDRMFYLPVYGDASYFFRTRIEGLSDNKKALVMREIHKQAMIPDQLKDFVDKLAA